MHCGETSSPPLMTPSQQPDPQVLTALSGADASRDRLLVLRTRRTVAGALNRRRADRAQERRSLVLALLLTLALAFALAPAIWAGFDELTGGALLDLPGMLLALGITLSLAVAAVLFLLLGERREEPAGARRR